MLLTKEVEVDVSCGGTCVNFYEDKGYTIPKKYYNGKYHIPKGTTIIVKIEDLSLGSQKEIEYKCDKCGEKFKINYKSYLSKKRANNEEDLCIHCAPSYFNSREKHYLWRSDLSDEDRKTNKNRNRDPEYTKFIRTVMKRDNYTCFCCNKSKGGHMVVHHLYSYSDNPKLRIDLNNGICLCEDCHKTFHKIYGKGNNSKEQFEEFCNKRLELSNENISMVEINKAYCLEDDEIIYNITDYCRHHKGCYVSSIEKTCNGNQVSVMGKHYMWYKDFLEISKKENGINEYIDNLTNKFKRDYSQYEKMKKHPNSIRLQKRVVCIENKMLFNTVSEASRYVGVAISTLSTHLRGRNKSCANLHWCYLEDYNGDINDLTKVGDSL